MNSKILPMFPLLLLSVSWLLLQTTTSAYSHEDFVHCLSENSKSITKLIHVSNSSSYSSILRSSIKNKRFETESTPKPLVIVTPKHASQIQATISCSVKLGMQVRVRSGGHDYEGLSHYSDDGRQFVILDLVEMRKVSVDLSSNTAWIQSGAQLGEVYYRIAEKSRTLGFPAGSCPTVGVGGHFSGGGEGPMMRKFGLAADNVIDAHLIDANGRILDRAAMGEDLFWAIRGGGGNTFGVVISWRVQLVPVPPVVTVFTVKRTLEQNATKLFHRWQYAVRNFDKELFGRVLLSRIATPDNSTTILTEFTSLYLGKADRLLAMMQQSFPELGLVKEDCIEMSWIESVLYLAYFPKNTPFEALLDRSLNGPIMYLKAKSDYVKEPIPEEAIQGIWDRLFEFQLEGHGCRLQVTAFGGRMGEISESSSPFPHRAGTLFQLHYAVGWVGDGNEEAESNMNWIRELYDYMGPYVSKNLRSAYINYRDLDIGINSRGNYTSYKQASVWGKKYFGNNFDRLVRVKNAIDPTNFFRNEQSIPPLSSW